MFAAGVLLQICRTNVDKSLPGHLTEGRPLRRSHAPEWKFPVTETAPEGHGGGGPGEDTRRRSRHPRAGGNCFLLSPGWLPVLLDEAE